jgi:hypothetical protein
MFGTQSNIVFFRAGQQMENTFNLHRTWIEISDLLFTAVHIEFCMDIPALPVSLCDRPHHL